MAFEAILGLFSKGMALALIQVVGAHLIVLDKNSKSKLIMSFACLLLHACGGGDSNTAASNQRKISNPAVNTGDNQNTGDSIDETLNTAFMIGKSTSLPLEFPAGHVCTDGTTPIVWTLTGDAARVSLVDPTKCHPTLTTTALFQGNDASIKAILTKTDGKRIKWDTPLTLKRTPVIDTQLLARNRAEWLSISRPQTNTNSMREISIGGLTYAQIVLQVYGSTGVDDGTVYFYTDEGSNRNRNITQGFEMGLNFRDQDGEDNLLQVSAGCEKTEPAMRRYMTECPFEFDPVNLNDKILRFRFKEDLTAGRIIEAPAIFRIKNVFAFASAQRSITDVFVEVRHPHSSEVARRVVGKILLYTYHNFH